MTVESAREKGILLDPPADPPTSVVAIGLTSAVVVTLDEHHAVVAERDEARQQRDAFMTAAADAARKLTAERDGAAEQWANARDERDAARRELKALQDSERAEVVKLQADVASARRDLAEAVLVATKRQAELVSARQELDQLRAAADEKVRAVLTAEPSAALPPQVLGIVDRLARELSAAESTITGLRTILRADPAPPGEAIERHDRYLCETCGARYVKDYPDHACGRLVPVLVTITRKGNA